MGNCDYIKNELANGAVLIDVREPHEFMSGSVRGSVNIPLSALPSALGHLAGVRKALFYCRSGARSQAAAEFAMQRGIHSENIGGISQVARCAA
jgi:rhodanese-related sulfurtransferase